MKEEIGSARRKFLSHYSKLFATLGVGALVLPHLSRSVEAEQASAIDYTQNTASSYIVKDLNKELSGVGWFNDIYNSKLADQARHQINRGAAVDDPRSAFYGRAPSSSSEFENYFNEPLGIYFQSYINYPLYVNTLSKDPRSTWDMDEVEKNSPGTVKRLPDGTALFQLFSLFSPALLFNNAGVVWWPKIAVFQISADIYDRRFTWDVLRYGSVNTIPLDEEKLSFDHSVPFMPPFIKLNDSFKGSSYVGYLTHVFDANPSNAFEYWIRIKGSLRSFGGEVWGTLVQT